MKKTSDPKADKNGFTIIPGQREILEREIFIKLCAKGLSKEESERLIAQLEPKRQLRIVQNKPEPPK
jgi:hypothetical protein